MLFDSHSHIQFPAYDRDRDSVIKRMRDAGVKTIAVGTTALTSSAAIAAAVRYRGDVWATAGFHPAHAALRWYHDKNELKTAVREEFDADRLKELARASEVTAIGECGLDYYRTKEKEEKNRQRDVFIAQVELASELKKPLMIHCRPSPKTADAYGDLHGILKSEAAKLKGANLHFFAGSAETAGKFLELGFYFSFGGVVTFSRDYDEVVRHLPLENILLETDAPYVAPEPFRGKRNEPAYIGAVAERIAALKGVSAEKIAAATTENAKRFFSLL
ncbi:MAG: TatD family hydrolase [Parcubacteria group bacterium]|nr:TatD family hydrolase [Parcubacteria group bacterium]